MCVLCCKTSFFNSQIRFGRNPRVYAENVMHVRIDLTINEYVFFHGKREPEPDPNKQQLDTYFVSIGKIERMDSQNKPLKS